MFVQLINYRGFDTLNLLGVYRPPVPANLQSFYNLLQNSLDGLNARNTILVGDINIDLSAAATPYRNIITSTGLTQCNTIATRNASNTIIDHIFSSMTTTRSHHVDTIDIEFSDHNVLVATIATSSPPMINKLVQIIDYDALATFIEENIGTVSECAQRPTVKYNLLIELILRAKTSATETKLIKLRRFKLCGWLSQSPELLHVINQKKNLWRKHKLSLRNHSCPQAIIDRLAMLSARLKMLKTNAKANYYRDQFAECRTSKQTWAKINEVISTGKKKDCQPISIKIGEQKIPDENVASMFVDHFATAAVNVARQIPVRDGDSPNKLNTLNRNAGSIFLHPTSPAEITNLIAALKTKKASGHDGISTKILKCCINSIAPVISDIINDCFRDGEYPDGLKVARVIPVYKSGCRNSLANYRPISVLPVLNDVFERAILNRLLDFLNRQKFFNDRKFGFRKRCGTNTALAEVINSIQCALNDGKVSTGLFMD